MAASFHRFGRIRKNTNVGGPSFSKTSFPSFWKIFQCRRNVSSTQIKEELASKKSRTKSDKCLDDQMTPDGFYPDKSQFPVFDDMISFRRKQALSSIVIQVSSTKSVLSAKESCKQYGTIKNIIPHSLPNQNICVVEFETEDSVRNLIRSCKHNDKCDVIPSVSPFLWLRAGAVTVEAILARQHPTADEDSDKLTTSLHELLCNARSISDQIGIYHSQNRMSDVDQRLRWITCSHIEQIFSGLFPFVQVCPFGSSINGCGRSGSDLDMAMCFDDSEHDAPQKPLVFQAKAAKADQRQQIQKHMQVIGDVLHNFATGIVVTQKILMARVPIIKFRQEMTGVDCDLSLTSLSGVYMSELIYLFGEIDWRFRPLMASIRLWAESSRLTRSIPGHTVTNFTLTMLAIFYLQRLDSPILPTLNQLIKSSRPQDTRITSGINCTFLRDPTAFIQQARANTSSLEDLFVGFLHFATTFPFDEYGISIVTGEKLRKREGWSLYVQNPLERELNVSKNVSKPELLRLQSEAYNALHRLESSSGTDQWGLLALLSSPEKTQPKVLTAALEFKNIFQIQEDPVPKVPAKANQSEAKLAASVKSDKEADKATKGPLPQAHQIKKSPTLAMLKASGTKKSNQR